MKRKSRAAIRSRPGPNIVRAWFDTVINPILAGLETEQRLLGKRNWTWQFRPGGLESIRPVAVWVRLGVRVDAWPNLEQFLTFHGEIKQQVDRHDAAVHLLTEACAKCHKTLAKSAALAAAYHEALSPESIARLVAKYPLQFKLSAEPGLSANEVIAKCFGGYPESDHLALLAQYVLNATAELPDYFTTAPLWNEHRQGFLRVLQSPETRPAYEAVVRTGEKMMKVNDTLIRKLKETRLKLSLEHDVPYVTAHEKPEATVEWPP